MGRKSAGVVTTVAISAMISAVAASAGVGADESVVHVCDPRAYGAVGDGVHNDTGALQAAIDSCVGAAAAGGLGDRQTDGAPPGASQVVLEAGLTFLTWPLRIKGARNFILRVDGTLQVAPIPANVSDSQRWPSEVVAIDSADGLTICGTGAVDGDGGSGWWQMRRKTPSMKAPKLFGIKDSTNLLVRDLHLRNSPQFHMQFHNSSRIEVFNTSVLAPATSPNTDGIDFSDCHDVWLHHCNIQNGDDEVAIEAGSHDILIEDTYCATGHGTSIGSIGENNGTGFVSNVTFRNLVYNSTSNGARVKTWQGGHGAVRNITYRNLTFHDVAEPILITQYYCPHSQHPGDCKNYSAAVSISDVSISMVTGTHTGEYAGELLCSDSIPCTNVTLSDINLLPSVSGKSNSFRCWKCNGHAERVSPPACLVGSANATQKHIH